MPEKELRDKYGGKLPKAINRAIRAEIPGGNEALDTLTALAGPARHSGWTKHNGEPTPEAKAYFKHKARVDELENQIKRKYGVPLETRTDRPTRSANIRRDVAKKNAPARKKK